MKAGDLHIAVTAQMGAFNAQMDQIEKRASGVGANFAGNFNAGAQKIIGGLGKTIAGPMIAAGIADSITNILTEGSTIEKEFSNFFDRLPFIGSFTRLGAALEKELSGENLDRLQSQVQYEEQAAADAAMAAELAAEKQLLAEVERLKIQKQRLDLNKIEDASQRSQIQRDQEIARLEQETADMAEKSAAGLVGNVEYNAFLKVQNQKRQIIEAEFADRMRDIDKQKQKELENAQEVAERKRKADEQTAQKQKEEAQKTSEELVRQFTKEMDEKQKEIEKVEAARLGVARETTALSTALGSFTISSYTDEEKKKNDETLVKEVKQLRRSMENVGAGGGFR